MVTKDNEPVLLDFGLARDDVRAQKQAELAEAVEDQLEIGFYEMSLGQSAVAVTAFKKALSLEPKSAEATVGLALTYLRQSAPQDALDVLDRSVIHPRILARTRARVLEALDRLPEAAAALESAAVLDGPLMWFIEGLIAMNEGESLSRGSPAKTAVFEEAESYMFRAVQATQRARRAYHFGLARATSEWDSPNGSAIADAIESLWPNSAHEWIWSGLARSHEPDFGVACLRRAIQIDPDSARARHNLGTALDSQGKFDEAIAAYREADRLAPGRHFIHQCHGNSFAKTGKVEEAMIHYRESIRINPEVSEVHYQLGFNLMSLGKLDEAVAAFREAIRINPRDERFFQNLARALMAQNKWDEAIMETQKAVRLMPDKAGRHSDLGLMLMRQGKSDEAIAPLQEAVRLAPDDGDHFSNLGEALNEQGRTVESIEACREAIRLNCVVKDMQFRIAVFFAELGRYGEAIIETREALQLGPDNATAHAFLGLVLVGQGETEEAAASLRRALEINPNDDRTRATLKSLQRQNQRITELRADANRHAEDSMKLNELAWFLVDPAGNPSVHDPKEALPLARKAVALTKRQNAAILDTLAVALAANKEFEEAVAVQEEITRLMDGKTTSGMTVTDAEAALERYRLSMKEHNESENSAGKQ